MKEASGELSMTAIAVVAIAAIGIVFTTLIWPTIRSNINRNTRCAQAFNCEPCTIGQDSMTQCWYTPEDDENSTQAEEIQCPCR